MTTKKRGQQTVHTSTKPQPQPRQIYSDDKKIQYVRETYAHLEPKAYTEFNRRLKRYALSPGQWNAYLNKVITEEVLVDVQKAEGFEEWLETLNRTWRKS